MWGPSVRMLAVRMEGSGRFCFLSRRSLAFGFVALRFPKALRAKGSRLVVWGSGSRGRGDPWRDLGVTYA